ncbi:elongation factor G [Striga asiatica]|uniref:Elongation factor G n=1 Tax=Striga asiatica TaxID=4170 RepID=A0A5A7QR61_STRAF|nr:elongation factor G [Striga asiatica]
MDDADIRKEDGNEPNAKLISSLHLFRPERSPPNLYEELAEKRLKRGQLDERKMLVGLRRRPLARSDRTQRQIELKFTNKGLEERRDGLSLSALVSQQSECLFSTSDACSSTPFSSSFGESLAQEIDSF